MTRTELTAKLMEISPIIDGMPAQDGILLMLTVIDGVAATTGDPQGAWNFIARFVSERVLSLMDRDDCAGTA